MATKDINIVGSGFALATEKVGSWSESFYLMLPNIVVGAFVFIVLTVVAGVTRYLLSAYFRRRDRQDLGSLLSDFVFWMILIFAAMVFFTIILPSLKPVDILASLGFGSVALSFAFKDILQNWLAGLLILLRLPFRRGDQIRVGEVEGTVQAIEPRATILRTYDGRDIIIPNTTIYTQIVAIHTAQPTRRVEIDLTVGYTYDKPCVISLIRSRRAKTPIPGEQPVMRSAAV